jgi:outer membrane protein OmpA-like peptidoglycan-associated protein
MRRITSDKILVGPLVFALAASGLLLAGCAITSRPSRAITPKETPKGITPDSPLNKVKSELNVVAMAQAINRKELVVRFPNVVLFRIDEYALRPAAQRNLGDVAEVLKRYPQLTIIVEGHTDSKGRKTYNQWLSEKRSRAVADFLVNNGVDPNRLQVVGYGQSRPVATNETYEGRERNRRVELHIKTR